MKIFITGGTGFVGTNLIDHLRADPNVTIGYCDNSFSSMEKSFGENVTKECNDVLDVTPDILANYSTLIHLAAVKKHNALDSDGELALLQTNVNSTVRLFDVACKAGIKNIIFASSLYANGNMHAMQVTETDPVNPLTLYGQSKLFGEFALKEMVSKYGIDAVAFRLYFIYGPNQYTGKGYPSVFIRAFKSLKTGGRPIIHNDGLQRLDYLYVTDLCDLFRQAIFNPRPGFVISNASSGNAYTIKSVVDEICSQWNKKFFTEINPEYDKIDFTAGTYRSGYNGNTRSLWNWAPQIKLADGISRTLEWFLSASSEGKN